MVFRCIKNSMLFDNISMLCRHTIDKASKYYQNASKYVFLTYHRNNIGISSNNIDFLIVFRCYFNGMSKKCISMVFWCFVEKASKFHYKFDAIRWYLDILLMVCWKNIEIPLNNIKFVIHWNCIELYQICIEISMIYQTVVKKFPKSI